MVSFGFLGTPTTIPLEEYTLLAKFGFNSLGNITDNYHNEHYVFLPSVYGNNIPNSEKKVTNICRFLNVDAVVEPGLNSILNINLKADVVILHDKQATFFQAKSSQEGLNTYKDRYFKRELDPFYSKRGNSKFFKEKVGLQETYKAPGAIYLTTKYGDSSLPKFLREFSDWIGFSINEDYDKLLQVLLRAREPISSKVLQKVFHDSYVMERVTHWGSIYPINVKDGYVQLRRQIPPEREAGRASSKERNTCTR